MNPLAEIRRLRRAEIVNLTMTELMVLLVFAAITFSFLARDEGLVEVSLIRKQLAELTEERDSLRAELESARTSLAALQREDAELKSKLAQQEEFIRRLLNDQSIKSLPELEARKLVLAPKGYVEKLEGELDTQKRMVVDQQKELGKLASQLRGDGNGTGYPKCPVTSGFLLEVTLEADGDFLVSKAWEAGAESTAIAVPGIKGMLASGRLNQEEFKRDAEQIANWGLSREVPCRFHVRTIRRTEDLQTYLAQTHILDRYFYATRP